jgi:hypothetical protein
MKAKMVSKDVGAGENVAKHELLQISPPHVQELNYEKTIYEMENHVGEEA